MDRRDFLTTSLLAAVAAVLAGSSTGCGTGLLGGDSLTAPTSLGNGLTITLANFPALATVGGIARVDGGVGTPLAVARTGTATFVALSLICTHQGSTLDIVSGGFTCPNHGATFAADGHWTGGQQTTNLVTYPVVYDQTAGTLQIGGVSAGTGSTGGNTSGGSTGGNPGQSAGGTSLVVDPSLFPALATVGGIARVDNQQAGTTPIAVVRTGSTTWTAFSMVCPHAGTTINIVNGGFLCPNHGAQFNSSGANIGGQSSGPLTVVPVTVGTDGMLVIGGGSSGLPASNVNLTILLATFPALATVGGVARVDSGSGPPVGVGRTGANSYVAYGLACPHQQATLVPANGGGWVCPEHGARFALDGAVTNGPATTGLVALGITLNAAAGTLTIVGNAPAASADGSDD